MALEVPASQIEEVNRFLQNPIAHPVDVVPPAARTLSVRKPRQFDQHVLGRADHALVDQRSDASPKRRKTHLVIDGDDFALLCSQVRQWIAVFHAQRHRLFQQQMPPGFEHGFADFEMEVVWHHRGDHVNVIPLKQSEVVVDDRHARLFGGRSLAAGRRRDRNGLQSCALRGLNRASVKAPPQSVADQSKPHITRRHNRSLSLFVGCRSTAQD